MDDMYNSENRKICYILRWSDLDVALNLKNDKCAYLVYCVIHNFTLFTKTWCRARLTFFERVTGYSRQAVITALNKLRKMDLIEKREVLSEYSNIKTNYYRAKVLITDIFKNFKLTDKEMELLKISSEIDDEDTENSSDLNESNQNFLQVEKTSTSSEVCSTGSEVCSTDSEVGSHNIYSINNNKILINNFLPNQDFCQDKNLYTLPSKNLTNNSTNTSSKEINEIPLEEKTVQTQTNNLRKNNEEYRTPVCFSKNTNTLESQILDKASQFTQGDIITTETGGTKKVLKQPDVSKFMQAQSLRSTKPDEIKQAEKLKKQNLQKQKEEHLKESTLNYCSADIEKYAEQCEPYKDEQVKSKLLEFISDSYDCLIERESFRGKNKNSILPTMRRKVKQYATIIQEKNLSTKDVLFYIKASAATTDNHIRFDTPRAVIEKRWYDTVINPCQLQDKPVVAESEQVLATNDDGEELVF